MIYTFLEKNMNIGLIKLKYGEEIICEYKIQEKNNIFIKNAAYMMALEDRQWHLMTWLSYTKVKDGVTINQNEILFISDLSDDMIEYYNKWIEALKKNVRIDLDK